MLIGYARVSTDDQDLTAQREHLRRLGVAEDRIYTDHGLSGRTRDRSGLDQAIAACRAGDTLVVTKLDSLARSVPDAAAIAAGLAIQQIALNLGGSVYDPTGPCRQAHVHDPCHGCGVRGGSHFGAHKRGHSHCVCPREAKGAAAKTHRRPTTPRPRARRRRPPHARRHRRALRRLTPHHRSTTRPVRHSVAPVCPLSTLVSYTVPSRKRSSWFGSGADIDVTTA